MSRIKLAIAAAMKAKQTWERIPPEKREALAAEARKQSAAVARKAADGARTHGPTIARAISRAIAAARTPPPK